MKVCQSFTPLISKNNFENPAQLALGVAVSNASKMFVMNKEPEKDTSCLEQSYSTYPVLFHIEIVQMFLIRSAWVSEEVFAFLGVQAATEALQPCCHATVCSTAFKYPAKFNSPGSDLEGILTLMIQIANTFYLQTDFAACRVSFTLNCTWLNCLRKTPSISTHVVFLRVHHLKPKRCNQDQIPSMNVKHTCETHFSIMCFPRKS